MQKARPETPNIRIEWDDRFKRWILTGTCRTPLGRTRVLTRTVNLTVAIDDLAMQVLLDAVEREMYSWLW